ncbi:DUF3277 family protein [Aureimonas fodinaquatilis]|uniref:DUF3277 family protein n=1 Tax=Aureimonas fodinaquatilis TaxID=2565783 RepID=A0A5B0E007_9HYPH|nr:phage protein [Aureimonas fodinaquatilis]KAA0970809.1 DUF3277 family protein [Aureimonas fodinaquatilis]
MPQVSSYGFGAVAATLDGQPVSGFWEGDDALVVTRRDDIGTEVVGADASFLFSQNMSRAATITLRLMHTSPTHRMLLQKEKRQRALAGGRGFPFDFKDKSSGEGGSTPQAYIKTGPDNSKGRNAAVRVWVLVCGDWNEMIPNG